jgi:hypothetical protein
MRTTHAQYIKAVTKDIDIFHVLGPVIIINVPTLHAILYTENYFYGPKRNADREWLHRAIFRQHDSIEEYGVNADEDY